MSNKYYHIDVHGNVVECKAKLRRCPRTDYTTKEAAYTALHAQNKKLELDDIKETITQKLLNPNTPSIYANIDASGRKPNDSPRKFAEKIDEYVRQHGQKPDIFRTKSELRQSKIQSDKPYTQIIVSRVPEADYEHGKIIGKYTIHLTPSYNSPHNKKEEKIILDFSNDFENEYDKAKHIIRETVIANGNMNDEQDVNEETDNIMNQLEKVYISMEEESTNPYDFWDHQAENNDNPIGTFKNSTPSMIVVDENYEDTTFRGKTFNEFMTSNPYYNAQTPDIDVRVYDNESGYSKNWWSIYRQEDGWGLQLGKNGFDDIDNVVVSTPDEARAEIRNFVTQYMNNNDEETAEEKSQYVYDLMNDIENTINYQSEKNRVKFENDRTRKSSESYTRDLFGETNEKSTMGIILNMFS